MYEFNCFQKYSIGWDGIYSHFRRWELDHLIFILWASLLRFDILYFIPKKFNISDCYQTLPNKLIIHGFVHHQKLKSIYGINTKFPGFRFHFGNLIRVLVLFSFFQTFYKRISRFICNKDNPKSKSKSLFQNAVSYKIPLWQFTTNHRSLWVCSLWVSAFCTTQNNI